MQNINDDLVILNISGSTCEHGQSTWSGIIIFNIAPEDYSFQFSVLI